MFNVPSCVRYAANPLCAVFDLGLALLLVLSLAGWGCTSTRITPDLRSSFATGSHDGHIITNWSIRLRSIPMNYRIVLSQRAILPVES